MVDQEWLEGEINRDIFVLDGKDIQDAQRSLEVWERMEIQGLVQCHRST